MKKHILLICNYYAPDHTIAAVRTTKLVKELTRQGYEVEVLAEERYSDDEDELLKKDAQGVRVHRVATSSGYDHIKKAYDKLTSGYRKKRFANLEDRRRINPKTGREEFYTFETAYPLIGSLDYLMGQWKQWNLFRQSKRVMKDLSHKDCVISSYGDAFGYFAGKYYKKQHGDCTWVFDIRDAVYRYKFTPRYVSFLPKRYERYIWRHADAVTGVSRGICKRVPAPYRYKTRCITNGYDPADREGLETKRLSGDKMNFAYTGSMYGGLCDLSAFFACVRELIDDRVMKEKDVAFHYAGNASAFDVFRSQAEKASLGDRCVNHGKLSRHDALQLQMQADFLLIATQDYRDNEGGVITGKLLEYMSAKRPVICVVTGDIENGEVAGIIRRTRIGVAYEEARAEEDMPALYAYLKKQYQSFRETGQVMNEPDDGEVRKYDYRNLGRKMAYVIERVSEGVNR